MFAQRCTICLHIPLDVFWQQRRDFQTLRLPRFFWENFILIKDEGKSNGHVHDSCNFTGWPKYFIYILFYFLTYNDKILSINFPIRNELITLNKSQQIFRCC